MVMRNICMQILEKKKHTVQSGHIIMYTANAVLSGHIMYTVNFLCSLYSRVGYIYGNFFFISAVIVFLSLYSELGIASVLNSVIR